VSYLLADKDYDANWFREGLKRQGTEPCMPFMGSRKVQQPYDVDLHKRRHKIENMFGRLKDWHSIATRYDRCTHTFFFAISIARSFLFYLSF
jgi:putative transposase